MKFAAMIIRTLKPGKTYEDYRRVWFHTVGFGVPTTMYTIVDAFNPNKIISTGIFDADCLQLIKELEIDVKERKAHSLDDIVESTVIRHFGVVIAVDDFSPEGPLTYEPAKVNGQLTDYSQIPSILAKVVSDIQHAKPSIIDTDHSAENTKLSK